MRPEEKRLSPRINLQAPLRFQVRGASRAKSVVSADVSEGGVGFVSDGFIAPETPLMLQVSVASRVLNPVGKVAWSERIPHSDRYRLGVEFIEIEQVEKRYLTDYIDLQRTHF
ncbi:PilZ domain-containing protein [Candidatus Omnitrophota bacterium]